MLTPKQIKNLKHGDPVVVRGKFKSVDSDGNFWIDTDNCIRCYSPSLVSLPSEHGTSLSRRSSEGAETEVPTTKHDPTRLFKKGDKVRVVEWNGRKDCREGMDATVLSNERCCFVDIECMIKEVKAELTYPACQLELVSPVEQLEPYAIELGVTGKGTDYRIKKDGVIICAYSCAHPNAKAAAEAERDRLNAEHRKEQNND